METLTINAKSSGACFVLPVISPSDEIVIETANRIEIHKPQCKVMIQVIETLRIQQTSRPRIFYLVPGFEAVPVIAQMPADGGLECRIRVISA